MIRVVLTVLIAVALMGVAMPALEDARTGTTVERVGTEGDRIERVAAAIAAGSVAVPERSLAARRSIVVRAPSGFAAARIDRLALVGGDGIGNAATGTTRTAADGERTVTSGATRRPDGTSPNGTRAGRAIPDGGVALVYRIRGEPLRAVPVAPPTEAVTVAVVDGPIELRTSGESRLEFGFVDRGGPTIEITRVG